MGSSNRSGPCNATAVPPARIVHDLTAPRHVGSLVRARLFPVAVQAVLLVALVFMAVNGLGVGFTVNEVERVTLSRTNLTTLIVWCLWWPSLVTVTFLFGKLWCMVCPLELASRLADATARRCGWQRAKLTKALRAGWGVVAGYLVLQFLVGGLAVHIRPHQTAIVVLCLLGCAVLCGLVFRAPRSFCQALCPGGALLSVYGRYTPLQLETRDPGVCESCASKKCVRGSLRYGIDKRSCPSLIRPFRRAPSDGCVLCLQCIKVCPHDNVGFGLVSEEAPVRHRALLKPYEAAFVMVALGFMTNEWTHGVAWLEASFHWIPAQLSALLAGPPQRWWDASWFLILFPLSVWGVFTVVCRLAGYRLGPRQALLAVATGVAPVVAIAHFTKAAGKINKWAGYLPLSLQDPQGMQTLRELVAQTRPTPTAMVELSTVGWLMLALLVPVSWWAWKWVQRPVRATRRLAVACGVAALLLGAAAADHRSAQATARLRQAYVAYAKQVQPLLNQYRALIGQIGASTDAQRAREMDTWLARATLLRDQLSSVEGEMGEINRFHAHLVASARSLTAGLTRLISYYEGEDETALTAWGQLTRETGAYLNAFIRGRDAARDRLSH